MFITIKKFGRNEKTPYLCGVQIRGLGVNSIPPYFCTFGFFPSAMQRYIILGKYPNLAGYFVGNLTFVMFGGSRSVVKFRPVNV